MAVTLTLTNIDRSMNRIIATATLTLTGNYGGAATHGDTIDFSSLGIASDSVPDVVDIFEAPPAGTAPNGYIFTFCPGTTQKNGVLTIVNNLTEYTQGSAYSAGLLGATIKIWAEFPAFI